MRLLIRCKLKGMTEKAKETRPVLQEMMNLCHFSPRKPRLYSWISLKLFFQSQVRVRKKPLCSTQGRHKRACGFVTMFFHAWLPYYQQQSEKGQHKHKHHEPKHQLLQWKQQNCSLLDIQNKFLACQLPRSDVSLWMEVFIMAPTELRAMVWSFTELCNHS